MKMEIYMENGSEKEEKSGNRIPCEVEKKIGRSSR